MALPMKLREEEARQYEDALIAIEAKGTDEMRSEATFIRQQLALHASYIEACTLLEQFGDEMHESGTHLVPLRFPMRLTHKTRESVEDGMFRSFLRFLQDLQTTVLSQHPRGVDDVVSNTQGVFTRMANALTLESCRVLDGLASNSDARRVCISYIEKCRLELVRQESTHLLKLSDACDVVLDCLKRFSRSASQIGKDVAVRMRAFLRTAERKGLSTAAAQLEETRQIRDMVVKHGWLHEGGNQIDDERVERVYKLLMQTHDELAHNLLWQKRRIGWLVSAGPANQCWCGLALSTEADGALVQAPAHMRSLAGAERVRLVLGTHDVLFTCYLSVVAVANVVLDLLHDRRLPLNRISAAYAKRILNFDFCKYESAARNILEDAVQPWYERYSGCELS